MEYMIGALVMWLVLAVMFFLYQETLNSIFESIISLPILLPCWIGALLFFPFFVFWKFIRNAVKGVRKEIWEKHKFKYVKQFGNIYFVYDEKAKLWRNKFFMVRVTSKSKNKIKRDAEFSCDNTPSCPEGKFRIGEE